ncbi:MAG TPA: hypothetical protein VLI68_04400 [Hanamia sp.]|jgi:hypothetical protein|nr:hypothetical protein [Hanamia sp.]
MKKLFFAVGVIVCELLACSSSVNLKNDSYQPLLLSENYFGSKNAIPEKEALKLIDGFPTHKNHFTGKHKLHNTWAMFDTAVLRKASTDANVDTIQFVLAAWTAKHQNYPTVIMRITLKDNFKNQFKSVQYIKPGTGQQYCPPPPNCTLY